MPDFETGTLAIGTIFKYQNPLSQQRLLNWLESKDFEPLDQESQQHLAFGPEGVSMEGEEGFAKLEDIRVLYNAQANLERYPEASFITHKNVKKVELSGPKQKTKNLVSWIEEDVQIKEDIKFFELTIDGVVRKKESRNSVDEFVNDSVKERLEESYGGPFEGTAIRGQATDDVKPKDWYKIMIDDKGPRNPHISQLKVVWRTENLDNFTEAVIDEKIDSLLEMGGNDD